MLSVDEKVRLVKLYYAGNSARSVCNIWRQQNPESPHFDHSTVLRLVRRFEQHGSVTDGRHRSGRKVRDNPNETAVLDLIRESPHLSLRQIEAQVNIHNSTVLKILKKHKYRSYHFHVHQELLPGDYDRRMQFCSEMIDLWNAHRRLGSRICFTDESSFTLRHIPNTQNSRIWAQRNPFLLTEQHTQYPQRVNVWAGLLGPLIIGPIFYTYSLNGDRFLHLLQEQISDLIMEAAGDEEIYFQMDGCPAHNDHRVRSYLQDTFPGKVISTYGNYSWPARSPDLSPNDFFLWGHIKTSIYHLGRSYTSLGDLQAAISNCCTNISSHQLSRVKSEFYDHLGYCMTANGGHFEQFLN